MATRQTKLVIKNNSVPNAPFSGATLLKGEAIVNTADGILMFSGITSSTSEWTPAGPGGNANFFEVGSNLFDLRLRNRITKYEGQTGSGLAGKFLSGTTNGFVLADISDIQGVDSYVTGATWNPNILTLDLNNGKPSVSVNIDSFSALTINGPLSVTGNTNLANLTATTVDASTIYSGGTDLLTIINNADTFVTGGTISYTGPDGTITLTRNDNINVTITGITDIYTTGATLVGSTAYFDTNDSLSAYTLDLSSFVPTGDTFVTGFTYTPASNTFTITQDDGPTLTTQINSVSGLSISNLTTGRVVYVGTGGLLTDESGFEYNAGLNLLTVGNINVQNASGTTANIGQGGLVIGSGGSLSTPGIGDLTVHGNLTVFGTETIVATTELYIEDPQITLNYNPTGSTIATSVASGIRIQDGNGIASGDTYFTIGQMLNLTSGDTSEYTGLTGYINRGWVTQLNDIIIRNTNLNEGAPDGVRVLAELDILDGGNY